MTYSTGRCSATFEYWFTYICTENEKKYLHSIENTLNLSYNWRETLKEIRDFESLRIYGGEFRSFVIANLQNRKPLIKDPIAIFATDLIN
jgi:hypothetical protein